MVICPTASTYLHTGNVSAEAVARIVTTGKATKYRKLPAQYLSARCHGCLESLGSIDNDTGDFLIDLGRRIARVSGDVLCSSVSLFCFFGLIGHIA